MRTRSLAERQFGISRLKRLSTSSKAHFLFTKVTCQQTCVHSCNKKRHVGIQLRSFDKILPSKTHSKDWKHKTVFENTVCKTLQQNSYAELAFMVIAAKTQAMMNAGQIPKSKQFKLWSEAATTVTALDNLIPVTWNGKILTWYEHAGHKIPKFVKY